MKNSIENLKKLLNAKFNKLSNDFDNESSPEDNIYLLLEELNKLGYDVKLGNYYEEDWRNDDDQQYVDNHEFDLTIDGVVFYSSLSARQDDEEYLSLSFSPFMTKKELDESNLEVVLEQEVFGKKVQILSDGTCKLEEDHFVNLEYLIKSFLK